MQFKLLASPTQERIYFSLPLLADLAQWSQYLERR